MAVLPLLAACITAKYLTTIIYNVFFHPLASVPGPFFARLSTLPSFYHACKGDRHIWIWQNFQVYGDRFRAAPNLVLFSSPRAYDDIHGNRANTARSSFYKAWKRNDRDIHTMNCSTDRVAHAKKRKNLNLIFTEQSMKAAAPIIVQHVDRWIDLLTIQGGDDGADTELGGPDTKGWSQPRNMAPWFSSLIFDIIGDLIFGETFDTKEPGENKLRAIPQWTMKTVALGYKLSKSPLFDLLLGLKSYGLNSIQERLLRKEVKEYNAFIEDTVDKRIAVHKARSFNTKPSPTPVREDMFHFLLTAKDPETNLPAFDDRDNLLSEARLLVLAGTDTTSTTLCALFFYLGHYSRVLAKLTEEIRSTFSSIDEVVYGPTLSKCKYLRACVDETLRMSFPAPSELSRVILSGGAIIDGNAYPAGTVVGCPGFAIGWNESVYGDVNIFRPERWIPSSHLDTLNSEADVQKLKQCFHPFSIGPMNCAGQNLAM